MLGLSLTDNSSLVHVLLASCVPRPVHLTADHDEDGDGDEAEGDPDPDEGPEDGRDDKPGAGLRGVYVDPALGEL